MGYLNKRQSYFLIALGFLLYMSGYIGRLNYSASMVEIIGVFGADNTTGGLVSSFFFFAYGVGQLVNGILSKYYNPRIMLTFSMLASAVMNLLMPFVGSLAAMKWLWLINGAVQSILWSTIIKTLSKYLPDIYLPKAILVMSMTVAVGTFCAYGLSALGIAIGMWQLVFFVAAAVCTGVGLLWFFAFGKIRKCAEAEGAAEKTEEKQAEEKEEKPAGKKGKLGISVFLIVFFASVAVAAIVNGLVKDGTVAWTPSVLHEEFGLAKSFSVILTFCLPLISICGAFIVAFLYKKIKNFQILIAMFYAVAGVSLVLLVFVCMPAGSVAASLVMFALVSCSMASINNILTSMIPLYFREKMNSGAVAGVINTFCYVGSTLSTVLLGFIADTKGWIAVFTVMTVLVAVALAVNLVASFIRKKDSTF